MEKLILLLFLFSCVETGGLSPGEQQDLVIPLNFKNGKVRNSGFLLAKLKKVDALISKVTVKFQIDNQIITRDAEISSGCEFCDQGEVGLKVKLPNNKDDGVFLKKRRSYKVSVEVFDDKDFSLAKKSFDITKVGFSKDFNNDGYDDFLLGNPMLNTVALIYGGRNNLTRLDNDIVPNANDLDGMLFGKSYSYGDYNGDGNLQLSISAEGSKNSNLNNVLDDNGNIMGVGEVYIFNLTLGGINQQGLFPTDNQSRDTLLHSQYGFSSKNVGDINLDGHDDLLVGAIGAKETAPEARTMGAAFMYLGGETFPDLTSVIRFDPRVSDQDGSAQFGNAVGGVGDINGDGVEDFAIGAPRQDENIRRNSGMVYLYFGGKNPTDAPNQNFARERDASVGNSFGTGDVNGDGFYDLITAARGDHLNATDSTRGGAAGSSFVDIRFGGLNGIEVISDQKIEDPDTELFDIDGEGTGYPARVDFVVEGVDDQGSGAGGSISVGDFNGDGYDDLCFPAYAKDLIDENGDRTLSVGAVWVYPGSANGIDVSKRIELRPTGNSSFYGILAEMNKDVNGDGFDDLIVGSIDFVDSKSIIEVYLGGEGETIDTTPDIRLELGMVYLNGEDSV